MRKSGIGYHYENLYKSVLNALWATNIRDLRLVLDKLEVQ